MVWLVVVADDGPHKLLWDMFTHMAKFRPVELSYFVRRDRKWGDDGEFRERGFKENVSFGVTSGLNDKH